MLLNLSIQYSSRMNKSGPFGFGLKFLSRLYLFKIVFSDPDRLEVKDLTLNSSDGLWGRSHLCFSFLTYRIKMLIPK